MLKTSYNQLTRIEEYYHPGKDEMPEDESTHWPTGETKPGIRLLKLPAI